MTEEIQIDKNCIPCHVAIIMDGNGRWAKRRGEERSSGHIAGADTVKEIIEVAARMGVKYLTLYTFSSENWNRPPEEVTALMKLLFDSLQEEVLLKNDICFKIIGDLNKLPEKLQERINKCIDDTRNGKTLTLVLALSYSSRWEIKNAIFEIGKEICNGNLKPDEITDELISSYLTTKSIPDPDLLIRTSGETRISNFLLWQIAYTELYFTPTHWPDFRKENFYEAICDFQCRERRFGKTN